MIISREHAYIFVAVHHTASTVIERELCTLYGGVKVRHKHSLPVLLPSWTRGFRVVGGVRNPASDVIAQYNKYVTNHLGIYTRQISGESDHLFMSARAKSLFLRVQSGELDLDGFIAEAARLPVVPRVELNRRRYTYVYRVEELDAAFPEMLHHLGLPQQRELPRGNPTEYRAPPVDLDHIVRQRAFRTAAVKYGYLHERVSPTDWAAYEAARFAKTRYWQANEITSVLRNPGFQDMQSAIFNDHALD